jgi:molybdenum cofactor cytidylyltransferase
MDSGPASPSSPLRADRRGRPVAGVLLAAGTSSRMGRNKLTLEHGGESLLRGAARRALAAGLAPLVVVLGHQAERARAELAGLDCTIIVNPDYEEGIHSSRRAGLEALPPESEAAVVLLADMPFVTRDMLAAQVERHRATGAPIVLSVYGSEPGVSAPPTLYVRELFPELLALAGGASGGEVAARHRAEAEILVWPEEALFDVDRPEDLDRLGPSGEAR